MSRQAATNNVSECPWRDVAWCFVLGACPEEERVEFCAHLQEGCALCGAELTQARAVIADLDQAVTVRTLSGGHGSSPRPSVRAQLLSEFEGPSAPEEQAKSGKGALEPTSLEGVSIAARSEEGWEDSGHSGVRFKLLSENAQTKTSTALFRMDPKSSYPSHRHTLREECFVLSGDLRFGDQVMHAGDYQLAQAGSVHPDQLTEEGCLLLIVASLEDELL